MVELAEEYVAALGIDDLEIETTRTAIEKGTEAAATDLERPYQQILPEISEIALRDLYLRLDMPDWSNPASWSTVGESRFGFY
jgi:hypothetical protein